MLTKEQKRALEAVFSSELSAIAVWGGGTALSEKYLHHRESEDIDIILSDLPDTLVITALANVVKKSVGAKTVESFVRMNRFQYFFKVPNGAQLKVEFVYYPFPKLDKPKKQGKILIESLADICASKTLAAYQRNEPKDAFDLYIVLNKKLFTLKELVKGVEDKFGEQIDPAALLARLTKSARQFDVLKPLIFEKKITQDKLINLFQKEFSKILKSKNL